MTIPVVTAVSVHRTRGEAFGVSKGRSRQGDGDERRSGPKKEKVRTAGNLGIGVLLEASVQNGVGNLIADLVYKHGQTEGAKGSAPANCRGEEQANNRNTSSKATQALPTAQKRTGVSLRDTLRGEQEGRERSTRGSHVCQLR